MSDARPRNVALDAARGAALVAMIGFHSVWDLADFGFLPPGAPFTPAMRLASMLIASAFLAIVGAALALAHRDGLHARAFGRRLAIVAAAAAAVSAGTYFADPAAPAWFGILHCIFVSSLIAAPLLFARAWVSLALGAAALAAPWLISSADFNSPALLWIGLGTQVPNTVDWRPLLPWAGVVWLALGATRLVVGGPSPQPSPASGRGGGGGLAWFGRHSLAVYLIHQPILFALMFVAANLLGVAEGRERDAFLASCRPSCVESGGSPEACQRACACIADKSIRRGFADRVLAQLSLQKAPGAGEVRACAVDAR